MIPNEELPHYFNLGGLRYIDDSSIPQELKQAGWEVQIWQKEVSDGTLILQVVIGPSKAGEAVGRRTDVLQVLPDGQVIVHWENCEHNDPCTEFFDALPKI
jgi:hypothetical protein